MHPTHLADTLDQLGLLPPGGRLYAAALDATQPAELLADSTAEQLLELHRYALELDTHESRRVLGWCEAALAELPPSESFLSRFHA